MRVNTDLPLERAGEFLRRKMSTIGPLHDSLIRDLRTLTRDRVEIPAGRMVVGEEERCPQLYLIDSGWVFRSRGLASGRRQIVNFALPGDFLCSDSILFKASSFDLIARTGVTLFRIETPILADMFTHHPGLAAALAWAAAQEESVIAERVVSLGRRDSLEKLAHILCEIAARLEAIGRMTGDIIETPLNQEDFADILGISVIHVNRTFRKLSEDKIAEYRKGQIELLDRQRLAELSAFDPDYLHFGHPSGG
ncbi:MAG: helix-turn-helix domain-containing protein [Alphaproteobacteria bacterium]|nr:helix-turn-helix domain-containing protein [Alphaproteobacteria bacterium]